MKYVKTFENFNQKLEIRELKKGDFLKKNGSKIELKVIEVGHERQSGYDFVVLYNDVTDKTDKLIDITNYSKVK